MLDLYDFANFLFHCFQWALVLVVLLFVCLAGYWYVVVIGAAACGAGVWYLCNKIAHL